jgi:hemerythrin-like domain-containing protein
MKPRGPLMHEHRLIEKMLKVVRNQISIIEKQNCVDPVFLDTAVDFIRTYADRTHHGKEEDILFKVLATKNMAPEDEQAMQELIEEHKYSRQITDELVKAKEDYLKGRQEALQTIVEKLSVLVEFYPKHIVKEDKKFFPDSEKYLSEEEQKDMLQGFWELDKRMIHDKYQSVVEHLSFGENT